MKTTGVIRRIDDLGRIQIPKEIRRQLFPHDYGEGQPMELFMENDMIILRKYKGEDDK